MAEAPIYHTKKINVRSENFSSILDLARDSDYYTCSRTQHRHSAEYTVRVSWQRCIDSLRDFSLAESWTDNNIKNEPVFG